MYRIYAIFSKESLAKMNGIRGKLGAQAGHAYLHSFWRSEENFPDDAKAYKNSNHARKICVVVDTDQELINLENKYKSICGVSLVVDAGFTVFKEPTITCLGIGPIKDTLIDNDIKSLKLLT